MLSLGCLPPDISGMMLVASSHYPTWASRAAFDELDRRFAHSRERLVLGQDVDRPNDVGRHDLVPCQAVPLQHSLRQTCERQLFLAFGQDAFREGESEGHDLLLV